MKKYKINADGRVVALRDFGFVKAGDVGGFVKSETNLSHKGNCWIYGDAQVYGDARVCGDAQVYGNAEVSGNAQVFGDAKVFENAWIYGNAQVYGDAWVFGNTRVYGNADVRGNAQVCGVMRSDIFCFCYVSCADGKHRVIAGCRSFTMAQAREHWGTKHPKHEETYAILDALENLSKVREEGCV